jgi:hypothetical protein
MRRIRANQPPVKGRKVGGIILTISIQRSNNFSPGRLNTRPNGAGLTGILTMAEHAQLRMSCFQTSEDVAGLIT